MDGIRIGDSPGLQDEIWRYLYSTEPLHACHHCLGVAGKTEPHRLVDRSRWLSEHDEPSERLVDYGKLRQLEKGLACDTGGGRVICEN